MIRWYADNSELQGIWEAEIPDVLLFGGIVVNENSKNELCSIIESVKSNYKPEADFPIKWNFRGLEKYYQEHRIKSLYQVLLKDSDRWRSEIFQLTSDVDFTIIVSLIKCHGKDRAVLKRTKEIVTQFSFSNALMRVGLSVRDINPNAAELVLDWPSEGQRDLFNKEYKSAYQSGVTCDQKMGYFCGPLKNLRFSDSPLFASMTECSLLQFSDLIVGATREMVEVALGKKSDSLGLTLLKEVRYRLLGAPSEVIGRGIVISPKRGELYDRISETISSLYD
jgi:hypothetical protein